MKKEYLIDTLRANIVKLHGYPEAEGLTVEGNTHIGVKVPVGDTGTVLQRTEIVSYSAISVPANIAGKFDWNVKSYKPIA